MMSGIGFVFGLPKGKAEIWPPDYGDFRPIRLAGEGESVAEQLIRERR